MSAKHTPTPWRIPEPFAGFSAIYGENDDLVFGLAVGSGDEKQNDEVCEANAAFIVRAVNSHDELVAAARAHHAWSYCEHRNVGTFYQRQQLCAHAEYLTAKALATVEGRDFDTEYKGAKRLLVWPAVVLDETEEAAAEALVAQVLDTKAGEAS